MTCCSWCSTLITSCDSLVQTPVEPLLRLRTKPLLRRVLDTTGNAVSPLPAASSLSLDVLRGSSCPVWVHSCPSRLGRSRPLTEFSDQFYMVVKLEQRQGRVLYSETVGQLPHLRVRQLPRQKIGTTGNTAGPLQATTSLSQPQSISCSK